jgi:teichuronic acid biosynthesis glycosyltransferase TuaC
LADPPQADRPIRLLTFTTLYPNAARPTHGVFVENRLRHLVGTGAVTSTVLAPVPYVPGWLAQSARWGGQAGAPAQEWRHGLAVHHPRYTVIPRIGMSVAPLQLWQAGLRAAQRLRAEGTPIDLIDAHYLYPDGVAAIGIGRALGVPVVITARGSDVTQLPDYLLPRLQIRRAIDRVDALIAVSAALGDRLVALGAPRARVRVLRNGVDTTAFQPVDRDAARAALGVAGPVLISVGHLIERKGHDRVIGALALLPECTLLIVGDGPERARLEALAERLGVAARVRLLGSVAQAALPALYGAADVLVLASSREGWANVLLEAMACGTKVVASPIAGNDEVVRSPAAGRIAAANTPEGLAAAIAELLAAPSDRAATRTYAEAFGWEETSRGQIEVFRGLIPTGFDDDPSKSDQGLGSRA